MNLENIIEMWKTDSLIDEICLDNESIKTIKIHAKYLELFTMSKLHLKKLKMDLEKLRKDKWLYYSGRMTKEEMDSRNWKYDPFNGGSKPLKSDLDIFIGTDADVQKTVLRIEYQTQMVELLEEIINTLRWRHSHIRNIIDFRKFQSGG